MPKQEESYLTGLLSKAKSYLGIDGSEKPKPKYNYQTGRYEGETEEEAAKRKQRDKTVMGSFGSK
jgi:hypothetical protein